MLIAEFDAEVKNGCIEIPESLRTQVRDRVRVRVTRDEPASKPSLLDQWLATPIKSPNFVPLTRDEAHAR